MTTADHTPSRACYLRGCDSKGCRQANYRYMSRYRLDRERNGRRRVDASPAAAHVRKLVDAGWSRHQIATVADCAERTIVSLCNGHYPTIRADIAARIITAQPHVSTVDAKSYVDATGTIRRVRALMYIGHPLNAIAATARVHRAPLGKLISHEHHHVTAGYARRIAAAYTAMTKLPGNSVRARNRAQSSGWHGPLAWDDIDDPASKPETGWHSEAKASTRTRTKVYADPQRVAALTAQGQSAADIALQLGCHQRIVVRARGRAREQVAA
ncbi:hypothetical protein [Streptomyces venezuelae]|uniref:Helix-turn-helix domain containing protein n=1 Tax=Streptomyces venezuelae TaxID=54571 RepID=A0A5P2B5X1_STRVZ|nr:hypothetical protein [Streptomyces venezuelae]QES25883.1 hypothetical protein DEJ47_04910 [Streptomyces venezuelae]